ncbi:MAG TPA: FtsQ-type POTRA domain-containing protein [Candidatus Limnocylindrales bacterium]|nr:FtsQ-type POTRA domain-containing protein [Candidatus Limnocylindrales bacterium]
MWFKREQNKNRRLHRTHVLDVKLRSDQVRSTRVRLVAMACLLLSCTFLSLYLFWRVGVWTLDTFVYENADFAIQQIDVQTDGVIAPEQLRRWSGVKPQANLIGLDLAAVKRNLELVSVIDSVSVERVLPRTLKIRVTERDPIAQVNVAWADAAGEITVHIFQLDADGVVMQPLDPRLCVVPLAQMNSQLPVIVGLNSFQLQPGRRMELPQVQAALRLVSAFEHSPMAGLVDLRRVDVSSPGVVVATTGQGSEITFGLENLDQQLSRWRQIYNLGLSQSRTIASADLAVANNVPVRWMLASAVPVAPVKAIKPPKNRRRNV